MALINCPNCNGKVSTKASACPHCGAAPIAKVTESERIQKLADELGSMSAALSMIESGSDTTESQPGSNDARATNTPSAQSRTESTQQNHKHDSVLSRPLPKWVGVPMTAILYVLCFGLIFAYVYAKWFWKDEPLNVTNGNGGYITPEMLENENQPQEPFAELEYMRRTEDLRNKLNPDIHDLMKAPSNYVGQPKPPSK